MSRRPLPVVAVGVAAFAALLSGCGGGGAVHVDDFPMTPIGRAQCTELLSHLPATVADEERREVTGSAYAAAYGSPAIVVRCGVEHPEGYASDPCVTRNGIGWSLPLDEADDPGIDATLTLAYRQPALQVEVPSAHRPNGPSEVMADLAGVVRAHTRAHGRCS